MKRLTILESFFRWKWYPNILRIPVFFGSMYLIRALLFGFQAEGRNNALLIMWVVLWALQPVVFVVLGRFWCAVCPFSTAGDLVQRAVGNDLHPPLFLKKHGVWFAYLFFMVILIVETMVRMAGSTAASALLLMTIFTMAMIFGAFYRRRTWCRYLCPLGVGGGVFSRLRLIKLEKDPAICSECRNFECLQGSEKAKGCPMGLCVKKHDLDADCISCGNCLKNCPNNSPRLHIRPAGKGFISNVKFNQAESVFASSFIGFSTAIVLIKDYLARVEPTVGFAYSPLNKLTVILLFTSLSLILFFLFSHIIKPFTRQSQKYNLRFFGFFLIPVMFVALVNLTSIHDVSQYGRTLYENLASDITPSTGFPLLHHPLVSLKIKHFIQGIGIIAGSIISILFCMSELQKALSNERRNSIVAGFSIFLVVITGYSLYIYFWY